MENIESQSCDQEMENINANTAHKRKAYWFMVSPAEKELIMKIRKKESSLKIKRKAMKKKEK